MTRRPRAGLKFEGGAEPGVLKCGGYTSRLERTGWRPVQRKNFVIRTAGWLRKRGSTREGRRPAKALLRLAHTAMYRVLYKFP
jgi:hypothetical protein